MHVRLPCSQPLHPTEGVRSTRATPNSGYLLAVAFKIDSKIPPDKIQQVKDHKQLLKDQDAGKLKIDEWDKLKRYATSDDGAYTYQAHAPFNTRELLGAAAPGPDWEYHRY